jgi:hypothetical protein
VKLLVEPFVEADCPDGFEVAGAGAKGEAIESVEDAAVAAELGGLVFGACGGFGGGLALGSLLRVAEGGTESAAEGESQRAFYRFHCERSREGWPDDARGTDLLYGQTPFHEESCGGGGYGWGTANGFNRFVRNSKNNRRSFDSLRCASVAQDDSVD